jgi:hypothetical protein
MRKVYIVFAVIGVFIAVLASPPIVLEYNRVQNLCRLHSSRIATAHDAIDVMRNYADDLSPAGRVLSIARHLDAFRSDARVRGSGWHAEEWIEPLITRGYSVDFDDLDFQIEVKCDVLECGAIDISNCLTMGSY